MEVDPKPLYTPNPKKLDYIYTMPFKRPYNLRGTIPLIYRYYDAKDDDMWMYLPGMRRVRRMATYQTQDKMPGGMDYTWDTADTFMGNLLKFNITCLGQKETLMPVVASSVSQMDDNGLAGCDQYYQRRNAYIIKASYKNAITMTDIIFYVDPELWSSCYQIGKDMRGKDWLFAVYYWGRDATWYYNQNNMNTVDLQRRHMSPANLPWYEANTGMAPQYLSMQQLINRYAVR